LIKIIPPTRRINPKKSDVGRKSKLFAFPGLIELKKSSFCGKLYLLFMGNHYDHKTIEFKWQKYWQQKKSFAASDKPDKPKFYCLVEFPYPSGEGLHVGHPRSYTALDILARKRRSQGYNVLYPMGFDAFGLPSENYAIKTGVHPQITTEKNIGIFTRQLKALGLSFDWDRVVSTTDPKYYKWTQWIFLKMYEHGLAYKAKMPINWCLSCKIGLANEEVVSGKCERCGGTVEKREKEQWMFKITEYADRLLEDLDTVDYLERIKLQQQNWIGRSEGAEVDFRIKNSELGIKVFTTRPDTLFGATFMVISPEHEIISNLKSQILNLKEVEAYVKKAKGKSDLERTELNKDKTGVELEGILAINPVNQKEIPVFVADYVLSNYGTGAIMAVPAHDKRDYDFALDHKLSIVGVVIPQSSKDIEVKYRVTSVGERKLSGSAIAYFEETGVSEEEATTKAIKDYAEKVRRGLLCHDGGGVLENSEFLNGLRKEEAINKTIDWLEKHGVGKKTLNYKLRDWVFSRQRYWGEPIPIVYCRKCWDSLKPNQKEEAAEGCDYVVINDQKYAIVPLPESHLPLELPKVKSYEPTDTGESPLAVIKDFVNTRCPICGGPAVRETDTMPNWAGSNWYFLRYVDPKNNKALADKKKLEYFLPVDWYNGGMEHTTLHLLYSRFIYKFLWDIGAVPKICGPEPYKKRTSHGMILGEGGEKMSKSRGNVVNPDQVVSELGADTLRVYEMFMGPFDQAIPWDTKGVIGVRRFLEKVWGLFQNQENNKTKKQEINKELVSLLHRTIKKVGDDIESQNYNTAVSAMMIFVNKAIEVGLTREAGEQFLKILSPFAPHISEELWQQLGHKKSIMLEAWPEFDEELSKSKEIELVIQINGKVRDKIVVSADISEQRVEKLALEQEKIKSHLVGKNIKNVIFIPGRLINFVV